MLGLSLNFYLETAKVRRARAAAVIRFASVYNSIRGGRPHSAQVKAPRTAEVASCRAREAALASTRESSTLCALRQSVELLPLTSPLTSQLDIEGRAAAAA